MPPSAVEVPRSNFKAPASPLEAVLARIWAEVLKRDEVGTTDDVLGLGADSIHLFQIAARAKREGLRLSARLLMKSRTIAELARLLEKERAA